MTNPKTYYPSFDVLRRCLGPNAHDVYSRIFSYAQMWDGICYTTQQRIADDLGISKRTVLRKIKLLIQEGYLEMLPSEIWAVKKFRPTQKAQRENNFLKPPQDKSTVLKSKQNGKDSFAVPVRKLTTHIDNSQMKFQNNQYYSAGVAENPDPQTSKIIVILTESVSKHNAIIKLIQAIRKDSFSADDLMKFWLAWKKE